MLSAHVCTRDKQGSVIHCGLAMAVAETSSSIDFEGSSLLPVSSEDEEASTVTAVSRVK